MARTLTFIMQGREYTASPAKIDRNKLYGWTEALALDDEGNECKLVSMDASGTLIIPKGGTGLGILSSDGAWVQRSQLKAVYEDGTPAEAIPSSYEVPIDLSTKITVDEFLKYSTVSFYQLDDVDEELVNLVGDDIYGFLYSYRESYDGKTAFVLTSKDAQKNKHLFMLICVLNNFEMIGLTQAAVIEEETETEEEENTELDFSMF